MNNFVHRDLKPANIMLTSDNIVKLADFGLAKKFNSDGGDMMQTQYGTPYYQAPEILQGKLYNEKADLWSAGIILFQMLAGEVPFKATSIQELLSKVDKGSYAMPQGVQISEYCGNLIQALICACPEKRMSFQGLMDHPFIASDGVTYRKLLMQL